MAGQIERAVAVSGDVARPGPTRSPPPAAVPMPPTAGSVTSCASGSRMLSTGTWIFRSSGLRMPASITVHSRPAPTRKRPTSSSGRCVADRPMRWTAAARASSSSRSSVRARCAPRFVRATAWISSTITASASTRNSRAREVSIR